jgi:hypothetical protein
MDPSILRGGLSVLALSVLAASWATVSPAETLPPASRPDPKIGDSAVFRTLNVRTGEKRETSMVVISVDADKIVDETSGSTSGTRTYTRDFNLLEVKTGERVTFTAKPFWASMRFPLEVGQTWGGFFESEAVVRPRNRSTQWRWKANVVAAEEVTVPAGTFQAFKIEYDGRYFAHQSNQSWTGSHKETAWFAPGINQFVKRELEQRSPSRNFLDHRVIELLSYKPAP